MAARIGGGFGKLRKGALNLLGAHQNEALKEEDHVVVQDGKKEFGWNEISATAACGDALLLGFGCGALICIETSS